MGWGQLRLPANDGAGTTGQIEEANRQLDRLAVPGGCLAERVIELVKNIDLYV